MSNKKITEFTDDELVELAGWSSALEKASPFSGSMAQAELLRRNTEALRASSKSADHYADKMMGLSLIVGLIAFLQLLLGILFASITPLQKILCTMGTVALIVYAFRDYFISEKK